MRNRIVTLAGLPVLAALLLSTLVPAAAQTAKTTAKTYNPPRMSDGHPDLQGTYDIATLTPLDRPFGSKAAVLTKEEASKREIANALKREEGSHYLKGDRTAPPKGGAGSVGPAGNVGGYHSGWLDPG